MARQTTFHRALIEPNLVFGIDRLAFVLLLIGSIALIMVLKQWWTLVISALLYVALRFVFRADPLFMRVYAQYSAEADRYEPFVRALPGRGGRRAGRGKGTLC